MGITPVLPRVFFRVRREMLVAACVFQEAMHSYSIYCECIGAVSGRAACEGAAPSKNLYSPNYYILPVRETDSGGALLTWRCKDVRPNGNFA